MKRRILSLICLVLLAASILAVPASAAEPAAAETESTVTPRYVNISYFAASVDVNSSGKAYSYGKVTTATSSHTIYLSVSLQRYSDGYWSNVKTWTTSGTGTATIDKSYYVTSGYYYRTAATATVYTSGGSYVESSTLYSQNDYY